MINQLTVLQGREDVMSKMRPLLLERHSFLAANMAVVSFSVQMLGFRGDKGRAHSGLVARLFNEVSLVHTPHVAFGSAGCVGVWALRAPGDARL